MSAIMQLNSAEGAAASTGVLAGSSQFKAAGCRRPISSSNLDRWASTWSAWCMNNLHARVCSSCCTVHHTCRIQQHRAE